MTNLLTHNRRDYLAATCIILLCLLAWLPVLFQDYVLVFDDYLFFDLVKDNGFIGSLIKIFQIHGLWRLLGFVLGPFSLINGFYYLLLIISHILVCLILYSILRKLFNDLDISLWLTSLAAVYPVYYQIMVWNIVYDRLFATLFFLINSLILIVSAKSDSSKREIYFFISAYLATFLSLLGNECLFFALIASSAFVWLIPARIELNSFQEKLIKKYSGWAPVLGCLSFGILYKLFEPDQALKTISSISPETILSAYYYQKNQLQYTLEAWFSEETVNLIFYSWTLDNFITIIIISLLSIFVLLAFSREQGIKVYNYKENSENRSKQKKYRILLITILLLVGGSSIYVLGGGYSLDSRKVYPLFPIITLFLGWILKYFNPVFNLIFYNRITVRLFNFLVISLATLFITTAWLVTGIWHYEAQRYDSLLEFITRNDINGKINVQWIPNLYEAWPKMNTTWGFRLDSYRVLQVSGFENVTPVNRNNLTEKVTVIIFDPDRNQWEKES